MRRSHWFRLKRFKNLEAVKEIQNPILLKKREKGIFNRFFSEKKKSQRKKNHRRRDRINCREINISARRGGQQINVLTIRAQSISRYFSPINDNSIDLSIPPSGRRIHLSLLGSINIDERQIEALSHSISSIRSHCSNKKSPSSIGWKIDQ